jgi:tetratricopeptide (TPR) repeat protein
MLAILAPGALQEADQFVALADASAVGQPPGVQRTANLGAALYRAGRYKKALEKLTEAVRQTDAKNPAPPIRLLFLAMTHHQLGQTEENRKLLDQAVQPMDQTAPLPCADWTARLAIRPLRQEAEALIRPKP